MSIAEIKEEMLFQALYGKKVIDDDKNFKSMTNARIENIFEKQKKGGLLRCTISTQKRV